MRAIRVLDTTAWTALTIFVFNIGSGWAWALAVPSLAWVMSPMTWRASAVRYVSGLLGGRND